MGSTNLIVRLKAFRKDLVHGHKAVFSLTFCKNEDKIAAAEFSQGLAADTAWRTVIVNLFLGPADNCNRGKVLYPLADCLKKRGAFSAVCRRKGYAFYITAGVYAAVFCKQGCPYRITGIRHVRKVQHVKGSGD